MRGLAIDFLNGRIPKTILMQIEMNLRKGETLKDPREQYENNVEFHALLIRATGNSELIKITKQLEYKERTISNNILMYKYDESYVQTHRNLFTAIVDNNREAIEAYKIQNREHVNKYMNMLIGKYIEEKKS